MSQLAVGFKSGMSSGREQRTDGLWKHLGQIDGGNLRAVNVNPVLTGAGVELGYYPGAAAGSTQGYIQSIDRDAGVLRDLLFNAKNLNLYANNGGAVSLQGPVNVTGGFNSVQNLPGTAISTPGDVSVNRGNNTGALYFCNTSTFLYWDGANFTLSGGKLYLTSPGSIRTADIVAGAAQQQIGAYIAAPTFSTAVGGTWVATPITVSITTTGNPLRIEFSVCASHSVANGQYMLAVGFDGSAVYSMCYVTGSPSASPQTNTGCIYYTLGAGVHTVTIFVYQASAGTFSLYAGVYQSLYVTEQKR